MLAIGSRSIPENCEESGPRLELTTAEVRQVFALYSRPFQAMHAATRRVRDAAPAPDRDSLRPMLALVWKSRRTLAQSSAAALALGAIFLLVATPTFSVKALVLVEPRSADWVAGAADAVAPGFLEGQAEILSGAAIVRDGLARSGLAGRDEARGWLARVAPWIGGAPRSPEQAERQALARALAALSATPVPGTQVIELEYRTQDPAAGVRFVQAVIDGYASFARTLEREELGVAVRSLAAPARQSSPVWPRPLPVLLACLAVGLLAGFAFALRAERAEAPEPGWTEIREAAWAA